MTNQEAYDKSKEVCKNINKIMGIDDVEFRRKDIGILYFTLLKETLVHMAAESALDSDERVKTTKLMIPFIGVINIKFEDNRVEVESFEIDRGFKRQIKNALTTGESPIDERLCKLVVGKMLENYKDLL